MSTYGRLGLNPSQLPSEWSNEGPVHPNVNDFLKIEDGRTLRYTGKPRPGRRPGYPPHGPARDPQLRRAVPLDPCPPRDDDAGPGQEDSHAASCRTDRPVPLGAGVYMFEVTIVSKGRDGYIGIGFSAGGVRENRLPGWEPKTFGYHGDDGNAFESSGKGRAFGPTFTTGDTVSVLYNQVERTIGYFKNGVWLGVAFRNVVAERLYPAVGMRTEGEHVEANFRGPFLADLSVAVRAARQRVMDEVLRQPLPETPEEERWRAGLEAMQEPGAEEREACSDGDTGTDEDEFCEDRDRDGRIPDLADGPVPGAWGSDRAAERFDGRGRSTVLRLVLGYLVHEGFCDTAQELAREAGAAELVKGMGQDLEAVAHRRRVVEAVAAGDVDAALDLLQAQCPALLERDGGLRFRLQCQKYVEMVRAGRFEDALAYAVRGEPAGPGPGTGPRPPPPHALPRASPGPGPPGRRSSALHRPRPATPDPRPRPRPCPPPPQRGRRRTRAPGRGCRGRTRSGCRTPWRCRRTWRRRARAPWGTCCCPGSGRPSPTTSGGRCWRCRASPRGARSRCSPGRPPRAWSWGAGAAGPRWRSPTTSTPSGTTPTPAGTCAAGRTWTWRADRLGDRR